jgi:transcription elongation factor Elf1
MTKINPQIKVSDYLTNKESCPVCFEKSFLTLSKDGRTDKLICKQCDAVFVRDYKKHVFTLDATL